MGAVGNCRTPLLIWSFSEACQATIKIYCERPWGHRGKHSAVYLDYQGRSKDDHDEAKIIWETKPNE